MPRDYPVLKTDLSGKTVMVIGANTGIGLEAAKHFASMRPSKLIITTRSDEKAAATVSSIQQESGFQNVEGWIVELNSFASVLAFAEKVKKDGGHLDILVVNAGMINPQFELTIDGWESTVQVNHLSNALLSLLLIPRLAYTAKAPSRLTRLVIVASETHAWVDLSREKTGNLGVLEYLNKPETFTIAGRSRYPTTKLLNVLFTRALASHLNISHGVIVDCVTPGLCRSDLARNVTITPEFEAQLANARTSEEGSRQLIWASIGPDPGRATEEAVKKLHGAYISDTEVRPASDWVRSEEGQQVQEKLWNETIEVLSKVSPAIIQVVSTYFQ